MNDQGRRSVDAAKSAVVAGWLKLRDGEDVDTPPAAAEGEVAGTSDEESLLDRYMPTPQVAAVAVMALLAAGVVLGAVTDPLAQSASAPTVLVSAPGPAPEAEPEPEAGGGEVPPAAAPQATAIVEEPPPAEVPPEEVSPEEPAGEPSKPLELPPEPTLPPVTHLFMIVLGDQGYETTFGKQSASPYFSKTLTEKGELLSNYYAVTQGDLANEVALLSGQGPTMQTAAGCPEYTDIAPGTVTSATAGTTGQVEGAGCVYPAPTLTLPGQLKAAAGTWKAYVEDGEQPAVCGPGRNPLAYFHSLLDDGECAEAAVGLGQLAPDLKSAQDTPSLSYIVPNACHDGSELPCAPGVPAGLSGAESFLKTVVPEIEASPAYAVGGMIAITFAQAPQTGPAADPSACCGTPEYPNLATQAGTAPPATTNGPIKPTGGGGRVGLLLISPYVLPGSVNESGYYNHFSLLRSVEELFGQAPLGYAAEPSVIGFDESVYNNLES